MSRFGSAVVDFRYLRGQGYALRAALKLVGDHYQLTRLQRNVLFRGVFPSDAEARAAKLVAPEAIAARSLAIDWYNVLITVESYLKGGTVFLADDGVVRDAAAAHGGYRRHAVTANAMELIIRALQELEPGEIVFYLDAPISRSAETAEDLASLESRMGVPVRAHVVPNADAPLKAYRGIVASSDSVILDRVESAFDLPAYALVMSFGISPPPVDRLFGSDEAV